MWEESSFLCAALLRRVDACRARTGGFKHDQETTTITRQSEVAGSCTPEYVTLNIGNLMLFRCVDAHALFTYLAGGKLRVIGYLCEVDFIWRHSFSFLSVLL